MLSLHFYGILLTTKSSFSEVFVYKSKVNKILDLGEKIKSTMNSEQDKKVMKKFNFFSKDDQESYEIVVDEVMAGAYSKCVSFVVMFVIETHVETSSKQLFFHLSSATLGQLQRFLHSSSSTFDNVFQGKTFWSWVRELACLDY